MNVDILVLWDDLPCWVQATTSYQPSMGTASTLVPFLKRLQWYLYQSHVYVIEWPVWDLDGDDHYSKASLLIHYYVNPGIHNIKGLHFWAIPSLQSPWDFPGVFRATLFSSLARNLCKPLVTLVCCVLSMTTLAKIKQRLCVFSKRTKVVEIGREKELELWKQCTTNTYGGEERAPSFIWKSRP